MTRKPDDGKGTRAGYAIPHLAEATRGGSQSAPEAAREPAGTIEVEYVYETDLASVRDGSWTMYEIWTRNRTYHVDSMLKCIAVVSRESGQTDPSHSLLGARLTGGERRSRASQAVEIYFPLPMPGTEAVFRHENRRNGQYGHTSTIERVVMRLRKVRVGTLDASPQWDDLTGRFTAR